MPAYFTTFRISVYILMGLRFPVQYKASQSLWDCLLSYLQVVLQSHSQMTLDISSWHPAHPLTLHIASQFLYCLWIASSTQPNSSFPTCVHLLPSVVHLMATSLSKASPRDQSEWDHPLINHQTSLWLQMTHFCQYNLKSNLFRQWHAALYKPWWS